jgi:hypothetical protein
MLPYGSVSVFILKAYRIRVKALMTDKFSITAVVKCDTFLHITLKQPHPGQRSLTWEKFVDSKVRKVGTGAAEYP